MGRILNFASALMGGFLLSGTVAAGDVPENVYVSHEQPGVWNEASGKCSCYPYLQAPGASASEEACAAPSACYELTADTEEGTRAPVFLGEVFGISGAGSSWNQGFIRLHNEDADTGIHFYDDTALRHRIWNNNGAGDLMRISPLFSTGGLSIDQGGNVGINVGNSAPEATLDVNGLMKLTVHTRAPSFPPCGSLIAVDGLLALTSNHRLCVCSVDAGGWVEAYNGTTACSW